MVTATGQGDNPNEHPKIHLVGILNLIWEKTLYNLANPDCDLLPASQRYNLTFAGLLLLLVPRGAAALSQPKMRAEGLEIHKIRS